MIQFLLPLAGVLILSVLLTEETIRLFLYKTLLEELGNLFKLNSFKYKIKKAKKYNCVDVEIFEKKKKVTSFTLESSKGVSSDIKYGKMRSVIPEIVPKIELPKIKIFN